MDKDILKKVIEKNKDKIRVLNVELVDSVDYVEGFFTYKITFIEKDKGDIQTDAIIGMDITDALYRFSQSKKMKFDFKLKRRG
jgi:hypothetical protein